VEDLFEKIWGTRRPPAYQKWLLEDNPAGPPCMALAWDRERLVGHYLIIPVRFFVDDRPVLMGLDIDTMTHPDYRRQGVLKTLASECAGWAAQGGIAFTVGFLGEQSTAPYRKSLPFQEPLDVRARARPLVPRVYGTYLSQRFRIPAFSGTLAGHAVTGCLAGANRIRNLRNGLRFEPQDPDQRTRGLFDELWENIRPVRGACLVRDGDFVRWRYARPGSEYRILAAFRGQRPVGYACWHEPETADRGSGARKLEFLDLCGDRRAVIQGLVEEASLRRGPQVVRVTALANRGNFVDRALAGILMIRDSRRWKFILRVNREDLVSYDRLAAPGVLDINYAFNDMI
jgi:GNAT superfamily N-acetyltransferase